MAVCPEIAIGSKGRLAAGGRARDKPGGERVAAWADRGQFAHRFPRKIQHLGGAGRAVWADFDGSA
jgi:hypothetical protein